MSTNINVNVELSNLLRRNREDAAANRLAGAERRSAAVAAQTGKRARDVERVAQGRDPSTGNIQFGVKRSAAPLEDLSAYISRRRAGFCYAPRDDQYYYSLDGLTRAERQGVADLALPPWLFQPGHGFVENYFRPEDYIELPASQVYYSYSAIRATYPVLLPLGNKAAVLVESRYTADGVIQTIQTQINPEQDGPYTTDYAIYSKSSRFNSAYLITEKSVKTLEIPSAIQDVLENYLLPAYPAPSYAVIRQYDAETAVYNPGDITWDLPTAKKRYWPDYLGLLNSWGAFGRFNPTTPAIYDLFNDPAVVLGQLESFAQAISFRENYEAIGELLRQPSRPRRHIYADVYDLIAGNGYLEWTGELPATWQDRPLPEAGGYRTRRAQGSFPDIDTALLSGSYCYDWGTPGYCRNQLLSLGFSQSDLTP